MTAQLIDGKALAAQVRQEVEEGVAAFIADGWAAPGLAVVLVGCDAASQVYVENKIRQTEAVGMRSERFLLPADTDESQLLTLIEQLNNNDAIHGILVQFPLPPQIDVSRVISAIHPSKDVDGFNPLNVGRLAAGLEGGLTPCTPLGVMRLIRSVHPDIAGMGALVVGASMLLDVPWPGCCCRPTAPFPSRTFEPPIWLVAAARRTYWWSQPECLV